MTAVPVLRAPDLTRTVLDVPVAEGGVPDPWEATVLAAPYLWAESDRLRFAAADARVYVTADEVRVAAPDARTRAQADWLLYATATRAVLTFRRRYNLHAGLVVAPSGAAVAILGDSGAGKSTTTVELLRRGWRLGSDDIVAVHHGPDGPMAHPVERPIHLSDAAAALLGADPAIGRPIPDTTKRAYAVTADLTPRPLSAVAVLSATAEADVRSDRVDGLAALPAIAFSADRYGICQLPEHRADYLAWSTALCRDVPIWTVRRPPALASVAAVADEVARIAESLAVR